MSIRGESVQVGPWRQGVNFAVPAEDLGPDEIFDGRNIRVGVGGEAIKRRGTTPFNASALTGTKTVTAIGEHRFSAASTKDYAISNTGFYEGDGAGTYTARTGGLTITDGDDNTWVFANANGTLFGHNGVSGDALLKWAAAGGNAAAWAVSSRFTTARTVEYWDNRAWAGNLSSGTDRVWYSDLADITTFGANNFFQLGQDVTAVKAFGNSLAMHTEDAIHLLIPTGNAQTPYRRIQRGNKGTVARRAITTVQMPAVGEVQLYIRKDGIYLFNGDASQKISWKLDGSRYWDNVNQSRLSEAHCAVDPRRNEVWFWIPYGSGQTDMNHAIIYNYVQQTWYPPFTGVTRNCSALINSAMHAGGYDAGLVFQQDTGLKDNDGTTDSAIDSWFETASPSPGGVSEMKRWLFLRTSYDALGDYALRVEYTAPGVVGEAETIRTSGGYDTIGGTFEIGVSNVAGESSLASADTDLSGYDPTLRIKYSNGVADDDMKVRRGSLVFKPLGKKRKVSAGIY